MNIERNFEATLWRHRWRHHHKKTFFGIIWDDLFKSEVKLKLCLIFQNFQNGHHFEPDKFFLPEVEYTRKIAMSISDILSFWSTLYWRRYINFKISPILWLGDVMNDVMNMYSYNCSHNLMIHMHIEGRLWGHPVTSSMTSSSWKYLFWHNLGRYFHIWGQIEAVFNISKFSKWPPFWARDKLFYQKLYRKENIPER